MRDFIKKSKYIIIQLIILTFLLHTSLPVQATNDFNEQVKKIDTITSVMVKDSNGNTIDGNTEYPIEQGSKVSLFYTWKLENSQEINVGDYTEVQVPIAFSIFNAVEGDLVLQDGDSVGKFYLGMDGKLKLVYNEYAKNHSDVEGTVKFNSEFNRSVIKGENPVKIIFPISEKNSQEIVIKFRPNNVSGPVAKKGMANKAVNADSIQWTIDVNKSLSKVDNATVEDILDKGLNLDKASIKVYNLKVDLDGNVALGEEVTPDKYTVTDIDGGFKVELGNINNAYRIVYNTNIIDNTKDIFGNVANFHGGSSEAKVTITRGKNIEKNGRPDKTFNTSKITWTIDVNKSSSQVKGATVEDKLEGGLSLDKSSMKVYKLTLGDDGNVTGKEEVLSPGYSVEYTPNDKPTSFKVVLGDINDAYQIEYDTVITDMAKTKFTNNASFSGIETSTTVNVKRGKRIVKSGKENIGYNEKYIIWTIDVNTAEEKIDNAIVEDIFGPGLSLVEDSVKVYKLKLDDNGRATLDGEALANIGAEDITKENGNTKFKVKLGNITGAYRIVYRTNITDNDKNGGKGFTNGASLGSVGTGNIKINPTITNSFNKSSDGSINYDEKTMGWKITVNPIKEPISGLVIEDTFPNGGLTMLPDTIVVKKGNVILVKDTDYTLEYNVDGDWTKGFKLNFLEDIKDSIYTITYKTQFDPFQVSEDHRQRAYSNNARFTWDKVKDPVDKAATQTVESIASDNGSKSGTLDRSKREITWNIDLNYLSKNLNNIIVEDSIEGNQMLDKDSIVIYEYTVEPNGNMKLGSVVDNSKYSIEEASDKLLKIKINGPVNSPYRVVFKTKLVGLSQTEYVNRATAGGIEYSAKVSYWDSEKFVEKSGKQGGKELSWWIIANKSLSEIENATLIDTLSIGHEVIEDSFIVNRTSDNEPYKNFRVTISPRDLATGTQTFKLEFLEKIDTMYNILYRTKITTDVDYSKLSNKVHFEGDGVSTENQPFEKEIVVRITDGSGTGSGKLGSLKIIKVDGNDIGTKIGGVEFKLFDWNGKLVGKAKTDENGILNVPGLKFGKYTLKETEPVLGYQILDEDQNIEVVINSEDKQEVIVKNYKLGSITIMKVDSDNETRVLPGAEFEVKDSKGKVVETLTTGADGTAKVENLPFGEYKVVEKKAPVGYKLDTTEHTVNVDKDNSKIQLELKNTKIPSTPWEPDKPKGSITIKKVDSKDETKLLSEAVFQVKNSEGKIVETLRTGVDGIAIAKELQFGEYKVVEIKAPTGYKLDTKEINLTIGKDKTYVELRVGNEKEVPTEPVKPVEPTEPTKPEDEFIDVDDKIPSGSVDVLPKTGEGSNVEFYLAGLILIFIGVRLRRKTA